MLEMFIEERSTSTFFHSVNTVDRLLNSIFHEDKKKENKLSCGQGIFRIREYNKLG